MENYVFVKRDLVDERSSGIYTVEGDILPIQIIDSRQLSADENLWLKIWTTIWV